MFSLHTGCVDGIRANGHGGRRQAPLPPQRARSARVNSRNDIDWLSTQTGLSLEVMT
jgi:hypothetical protein